MDDDDFEAWQVCWKLNLLFQTPVRKGQKCILCEEVDEKWKGVYRSTFWREATRCSGGHSQKRADETQGSHEYVVCSECDQNFLFDIVKGKHTCRVEGCRRTVRVNIATVRRKVDANSAKQTENMRLLESFLDFIRKSQVYDCAICCEEVACPADNAVANKASAACKHDRNVCDSCLKNTYETAIRGGKFQNLICPDTECRSPIPKESIRLHVSTEVFKIYSKKYANDVLAKNKNFRWCTCGKSQIHGPGESKPEWICLGCKKRHCFICPGETSLCSHLRAIDALQQKTKLQKREEAAKVFATASKRKEEAAFKARENEDATKREIARTTKKCPKVGCGNKIERNAGCGHFTCKKCRTDFCWTCKVIWVGGTALHLKSCTLGNRRMVDRSSLNTTGYAAGWDKDVGYDFSLDTGLFLIDGHM